MVNGILHFEDGSFEFIENAQDFAKVVRERMGDDSEQMVLDLIKEADDTEQRINSDLRGYEMSCERFRSEIQEASDGLSVAITELSKSRVPKSNLTQRLTRIKKGLEDQL